MYHIADGLEKRLICQYGTENDALALLNGGPTAMTGVNIVMMGTLLVCFRVHHVSVRSSWSLFLVESQQNQNMNLGRPIPIHIRFILKCKYL